MGQSERRITVLDADDWIGIYDGDRLVFEGHSIEPVELCRVLGLTARLQFVDELPSGSCPERLSDLEAT